MLAVFLSCLDAMAEEKPQPQTQMQMPDPYAVDLSTSEPLEPLDDNTLSNDPEFYDKTARGFVNTGIVLFPMYSKVNGDDTAGGGTFMYYFRRHGEPPLSEPNYIRTTLVAGQNQYVDMNVSFNNYWDTEEQNLYTSFGYQRRLANFYQPFTQTPSLLGTYRTSDFIFDVMYRQKFVFNSYVGVKYEYVYNGMDSKTPADIFVSNAIYGLNGDAISGFGLIWSSLPVEDIFSPKRTSVFELSSTLYLKYFGSKYNFARHILDIREYFPIRSSHVFELEFYFSMLTGEVPYRQLLSVAQLFKAYPFDKYMDNNLIGIKGEYRFLLFTRTYFSLFLGTAYHANSVKKFKMNEYLPSYGAGLRFLIDSELNINARLDYLVGRDAKGFMIGVGEGF